MKKVFLFAVATIAISLASCKNNGAADKAVEPAVDSTATVPAVEAVEETVLVQDDTLANKVEVASVEEVSAGK